jgi:hypothetical protein
MKRERRLKLEKQAVEVILEKVSENSEMPVEKVMEIVEPHYLFDPVIAREREIRQKAHQIIAKVRDEKGIRDIYVCGDKYVNVTKTKDKESLKKIRQKQEKLHTGIGISVDKLNVCEMIANGQEQQEEVAK